MKQKIILYSICLCLFFACKKDKKAPDPAVKLYPISFNVSGFSTTLVPNNAGKAKTTALATQADTVPVQYLTYMLLQPGLNPSSPSNAGTLINTRRAAKGDTGFGTFTDNVPAGKYTVVFGGGSNNLKYNSGVTSTDVYYYGYYFYYSYAPTYGYPFTGPTYWDDTFYKAISITVTSSGIVNQDVSLDRVVSRLDVLIKDAIPTGTSKITISIVDTAAFYIGKGTGVLGAVTPNNTITKTVSAADIGKTNTTISMYTRNNIKPFNVTINYYGADTNSPIGSRVVTDVVCKWNTKTILSGNLFTAGNSNFSILANQNWNTPITVNF